MPIQHTTRILALLALLAGCAGPPGGEREPAPEPEITIRGSLAFRESIAPPPGSVATVMVGEFGGEGSAPVASATIELDHARTILPFELTAPVSAFRPAGQYAVTARVSAPDDGTHWTTDVAQIVDVTQEAVDIGVLLMTPSRRHPRRDFD